MPPLTDPAANHKPADPPEPSEIRAARERVQLITGLGITAAQRLCAAIVETELRRFQEWEAGKYRMHPGLWKLLVLELAKVKPRRKSGTGQAGEGP